MESKTTATKGIKPLRTFYLDGVSVSLFANERTIEGKKVTLYNVAISKLYKKGNLTKRSHSFASVDVAKLMYLLWRADKFMLIHSFVSGKDTLVD